jgi:hypothetical protein
VDILPMTLSENSKALPATLASIHEGRRGRVICSARRRACAAACGPTSRGDNRPTRVPRAEGGRPRLAGHGHRERSADLENNLTQHHPRYNVRLRDQKTYIGLRLNMQDKFPRLTTTRRVKPDGSLYFGPYTQASPCGDGQPHPEDLSAPLLLDAVFAQYRAGRPASSSR